MCKNLNYIKLDLYILTICKNIKKSLLKDKIYKQLLLKLLKKKLSSSKPKKRHPNFCKKKKLPKQN